MIDTETPTLASPLTAPTTLEETGLSFDTVLQLVAKTLHFAGELNATDLAQRLGLQTSVIEPCLDLLKRERHCEIVGGGMLRSPTYRYRLTDAGRIRAALFSSTTNMWGTRRPAEQYRAYMNAFHRAGSDALRSTVRSALPRAERAGHRPARTGD